MGVEVGTTQKVPTMFVAHGGGPMPLLGADMECRAHLESISKLVSPRPSAIVVATAHWEASPVRVSAAAKPKLYFDYYGFPEESYRYEYPAPGSPALAAKIQGLLGAAGIPCDLDTERGLDHGVFVPMLLAYPEADVPVVALSLHSSLDAAKHVSIGRALRSLRDEGVLIIASGMSYHNMRTFFSKRRSEFPAGAEFDADLEDAVLGAADAQVRNAQLGQWTQFRGARDAHPREEHLLPLMVAAGAAEDEDKVERVFDSTILGARVAAYRFGGGPST